MKNFRRTPQQLQATGWRVPPHRLTVDSNATTGRHRRISRNKTSITPAIPQTIATPKTPSIDIPGTQRHMSIRRHGYGPTSRHTLADVRACVRTFVHLRPQCTQLLGDPLAARVAVEPHLQILAGSLELLNSPADAHGVRVTRGWLDVDAGCTQPVRAARTPRCRCAVAR